MSFIYCLLREKDWKIYSKCLFPFHPRTYRQIHTPTVVQGEGRGGVEWNPSPVFFYILHYFETILPLVESLWSS